MSSRIPVSSGKLTTTPSAPASRNASALSAVARGTARSSGKRYFTSRTWSGLEPLVPLLFKEANPMPIKHCLWRQGLIASPECRLPLMTVSAALADELDRALKDAVV